MTTTLVGKHPACWLAALLAVAAGVWAAPAWAQDIQTDPTYGLIADDAMRGSVGQWLVADAQPAADTATELATLRESVRRMEEKSEAAALRAASKPSAELFGRTFVDFATFSQDALNKSAVGVGQARNGFGFRSARIGIKGRGFNVIDYSSEIEFVSPIYDEDGARPVIGDGVAFRDFWLGVSELPLIGTIKVGHFREPFSLEQLTSSRNISFLERSMSDSLFVPGFRLGAAIQNNSEDERMTWCAGVFPTDLSASPPIRNFDDIACQFATRVTWLPWYDAATDGRGLLHTGVGYYYANAFHDSKTFAAKINSAFGPTIINSGALAISDWQCMGLELAWVYGPLSLQGEYFGAVVDPKAAGLANGYLEGFYIMASYFLTGENRPYNRKAGAFDRVRPLENFFRVRTDDGRTATGWGAWEVLYRFDYADIYDLPVPGDNILGQASTHTLGMNWYLTPYARMMWNLIHADTTRNHAAAGNLDAFTMRCQIDF